MMGYLSRILPVICARTLRLSPKKSGSTESMTYSRNAPSTIPITFAQNGSGAGVPTSAGRSSSARPDVPPVSNATRSVSIFQRNSAAALNGLPMSATAVQNQKINAPSHTNTFMTQGLHSAVTRSCGHPHGKA